MLLSKLPKPTDPAIDISHFQEGDLTDILGDIDIRRVDGEVEQDDDFGPQLSIAVDYLRRQQNVLAFLFQLNEQDQIFSEKTTATLTDLVEEVEEFLGDYDGD